MALPTLKFFIDPTNNNAYYGLNDNSVITDPYFFYGDTKTIELYLRRTVNGTNQLITWPASPSIKVSIGPIDDVPTAGTFTVTYGADTTSALAYNITAAAFQTALNALASITSAGGVVVTKVGDNYNIEFNNTGNRTSFTANTGALFPLSTGVIAVVQDGTSTSPEIVIFHLRQSSVVNATSWSSVGTGTATKSTLSAWASSGLDGSVTYALAIDERIVDGTFTLTYSADDTDYNFISAPINFGASALDIYNAIGLTGSVNNKPAVSVNKISDYSYTISIRYEPDTGLSVDASGLINATGYKGTLAINTPGSLVLLDGNELVETYLAVQITESSAPQTVLQIPCTLLSSVIIN
jgi:hypothetical protein